MRLKAIFLLLLVAITATTSCVAKVHNNNSTSKPAAAATAATDTIMQKAVGDSIYQIITKAKRVEITSLPLQSDSIKQAVSRKVSSKDLELMKFIATNPRNYMSDVVAYGVFMPQFQASYAKKKAKVILKYDFGLRKWGVFNAEDKQIAMFDLASDNMLRFACKMFPDNQFFHKLLLTRE